MDPAWVLPRPVPTSWEEIHAAQGLHSPTPMPDHARRRQPFLFPLSVSQDAGLSQCSPRADKHWLRLASHTMRDPWDAKDPRNVTYLDSGQDVVQTFDKTHQPEVLWSDALFYNIVVEV